MLNQRWHGPAAINKTVSAPIQLKGIDSETLQQTDRRQMSFSQLIHCINIPQAQFQLWTNCGPCTLARTALSARTMSVRQTHHSSKNRLFAAGLVIENRRHNTSRKQIKIVRVLNLRKDRQKLRTFADTNRGNVIAQGSAVGFGQPGFHRETSNHNQ